MAINAKPQNDQSLVDDRDPELARTPTNGWDEPAEVIRAKKFVNELDGDYLDGIDLDAAIETLRSFGIAPDRTFVTIYQRYPILKSAPDLRDGLRRQIHTAYVKGKKPPGYNAVGGEFEGDREPEFTITGLTVRRGSDIRPQPIHWIWDKRIPRGKLTIIAGFPDQGKSLVAASIAAKITTGGEWPDGEGFAPQGVAIYLSSEDDAEDTLIPRLMAAGADMDNILILDSMVRAVEHGKKKSRVLNIEDDLKKVTRAIEDERDKGRIVRAVIFDPLNAFFGGAKKADSHNSGDMRTLLTPMAAWSAKMQIAICGIMHFNKAENSTVLYRITGSLAVSAAARSVWYCAKDLVSDEESFVMVQGKHNLSKSKAGLAYKIKERDIGENELSAPYVEWTGPTTLTKDDAFAVQRREREPEAVNTALEVLKDAFAGVGVILTAEQMDECQSAASVSDHTFRRAKEQLGVIRIYPDKVGGRYRFRLRTAANDFADELSAHS